MPGRNCSPGGHFRDPASLRPTKHVSPGSRFWFIGRTAPVAIALAPIIHSSLTLTARFAVATGMIGAALRPSLRFPSHMKSPSFYSSYSSSRSAASISRSACSMNRATLGTSA